MFDESFLILMTGHEVTANTSLKRKRVHFCYRLITECTRLRCELVFIQQALVKLDHTIPRGGEQRCGDQISSRSRVPTVAVRP